MKWGGRPRPRWTAGPAIGLETQADEVVGRGPGGPPHLFRVPSKCLTHYISEQGPALPHETDGSAAGAAGPFPRRAPRRVFPPPAACIPNRWDENGRRTAGTAKPIAYRYEVCRWLRSAFIDHLSERPLDFGKWSQQRRAAGIENDIPLRPDFSAVQSKRLAEAPLDPVPRDRSADGAWHRETQSRAAPRHIRPRHAERSEQGTGKADTVVIRGSKIGSAQDPARGRKRERTAGGGARRSGRTGRLFRH